MPQPGPGTPDKYVFKKENVLNIELAAVSEGKGEQGESKEEVWPSTGLHGGQVWAKTQGGNAKVRGRHCTILQSAPKEQKGASQVGIREADQGHVVKAEVSFPGNTGTARAGMPLLLSHFSHVRLCATPQTGPPGSPVPGILQARTLEGVATPSSRPSS